MVAISCIKLVKDETLECESVMINILGNNVYKKNNKKQNVGGGLLQFLKQHDIFISVVDYCTFLLEIYILICYKKIS